MKLIKYITSFILFFITLIFIGEIYVWNLDSFETEYKYVTFYLQENTTKSEMLNDIVVAAEKENVSIFVVDKKFTSLYTETINIYTTNKEAQNFLALNSMVKEGRYESIFLGQVNVEYFEWFDIPDIEKIEYYYVIGKDENIINFKKLLVDKYAGRFPKNSNQIMNTQFSVGVVWFCVIAFLLLLTFYEVAKLKKIIILKIAIGERISIFIIKKLILDIIIYSTVFLSLFYMLSLYTNTFYLKNMTILYFGLFLFLNSLSYLFLFFTDYKKDMQTLKTAKSVLKISYLYKIITSVVLIITMTGCIELIFEGINYYKQKDFFEMKQNYYYITVGGSNIEDAKEMLNKYYTQGRKTEKKIGLIDLGKWLTNVEYILADQGAVDYLYTRIPEIQNKILENKIYYLVPEQYQNKDIYNDMKTICYTYYEAEYDYEIIEYKKTSWVMAISNSGKIKSTLKKNPVIILNNMDFVEIPNSSMLYIGNATMYSFSDKEFENIASSNFFGDMYYKTNVYENYKYFWNMMKRNMLMGIVFLMILLILEGLILRTVLKYEYQINAKELLLNKMNGNSFFYRQKKIILLLLGGWLSLIISITISIILGFSATLYILISGILVLLMEHLLVILYSHKLDKANISKIFKGGML